MSLISVNVTIANGASQSSVLDLTDIRIRAIQMPAVWTAATITLLAATTSGGTYQSVVGRTATEASITATAAEYMLLGSIDTNANFFDGLMFVKLRSGTSGTPVNQAADRIIEIICEHRATAS